MMTSLRAHVQSNRELVFVLQCSQPGVKGTVSKFWIWGVGSVTILTVMGGLFIYLCLTID